MRWAVGLLALSAVTWLTPLAEARTWYLQASQPSWDILAGWYSQPLDGGEHPASINGTDEFDLNGFNLRTSGSSGQTFAGKTLILTGGEAGLLNVRTAAPAMCVIPSLVSNGGKIQNYVPGANPSSAGVEIKNFKNLLNTTFSTGTSSRGLDIVIGDLTGDGDLTLVGMGGGAVSLKINNAKDYHGRLYVADGCALTFGNAVVSAGSLEVCAGTSVVLDQIVTFHGLSVNGTTKPPGVYTAASLAMSGTGSITVKPEAAPANTAKSDTRAGKAREHMYGVNFPGGGFAQAHYPTDPIEWDVYHSKGLNLIRVAFLWERVQPTLNGDLEPSAMEALDKCLDLAAERGMKVILDMHNYDRFPMITGTGKTEYLIGSPEVPYSAYTDVWKKLAAHFVNKSAVYAYDIMNEPHKTYETWPAAAQAGVDGIRQSDNKHYVLIEGDGFANSARWMMDNGTLAVKDPAGLVIYSAHIYFDSNYSGKYGGDYDSNHVYPNIGIDRTAAFVHWLKLRKAKGLFGEYGIPSHVQVPDPRWYTVLDKFMSYIDENGISGTYWAAGNCWSPGYLLQIGRVPFENGEPEVLSYLQKYR